MDKKVEDLLQKLITKVSLYNIEGLSQIQAAFEVANKAHEGQYRDSGDPYIIHPLEVAIILTDIGMDTATVTAGLLHDVVEDTSVKLSELEEQFGFEVAMLVDGVTNFSKINFSNREERKLANNRKVIMGIVKDLRILIIKLADRLHNMRTLEYKQKNQKEISMTTREIYVPLANKIGLNRIKNELEDLSFYCLEPEEYKKIDSKVKREQKKISYIECIKEVRENLQKILNDRKMPYEIKIRVKNYYSIYKDLLLEEQDIEETRLSTIHDLVSFKVMLDIIDNCYLMLRPVHELYKPVNGTFKDYICNPKPNMYQSLHTTVYGPKNRQVQVQLKTFEMGYVASFGLIKHWNINNQKERARMQAYIKTQYPLYDSILELDQAYGDNNRGFVDHLKEELIAITVINDDGREIELPVGSTVVDFAYALGEEIGNRLAIATVNDHIVDNNYILNDQDQVRIITNAIGGPKPEWSTYAKTAKAQNMILKYTSEKSL